MGIPSLKATCGLRSAMISRSMVQSSQSAIHDSKPGERKPDIAVVPLAMPMIAGPGAIVTVIVATHQHKGIESNPKMSVVFAVLAGVICLCFLSSPLITRVLGAKGLDSLTKFRGLLLLAVAVGMFTTGLKGLWPGLAE